MAEGVTFTVPSTPVDRDWKKGQKEPPFCCAGIQWCPREHSEEIGHTWDTAA